MNDPRDSASYRAVRFAAGVATVGFLVAALMGAGSWWIWQREKKLAETSLRDLAAASNRLEAIKRERDDLMGSEETYRILQGRGVFLPESRMDFIETMETLKARHRLLGLDYELRAQRPLKFASGASYGAAEIRASRLIVKVRALHDQDFVSFIDEFPRIRRGFFPVDRCLLKRPDPGGGARPAVSTAGPRVAAPAEESAPALAAGIEAECHLEWITLVDKGTQAAGAALSGSIGKPGT
jgi:hypothetical protein